LYEDKVVINLPINVFGCVTVNEGLQVWPMTWQRKNEKSLTGRADYTPGHWF